MRRRGAIILVLQALLAIQRGLVTSQAATPIADCNDPAKRPIEDLYDFHRLTLQSRGGYCFVQSCKDVPIGELNPYSALTFRSVVPLLANGTELSSCMEVPIDIPEDNRLRELLENIWPSYDPDVSNEALWEDEMRRHGSCIACRSQNVTQLLKEGFLSYQEFLYKLMKNVHPSFSKPVPVELFREVFNDLSGELQMELHCEGQLDDLDVLQEVRIYMFVGVGPAKRFPISEDETCKTEKIWYLGNGDPK